MDYLWERLISCEIEKNDKGWDMVQLGEVLEVTRNFEAEVRKNELERVYEQLNAGLCDVCVHHSDKCFKTCSANNYEMETFKQWLQEQLKEQSKEHK